MNDITSFFERQKLYDKSLREANAANRGIVFDALAAASIASVTVEFDGEGDSGQIEQVTFCREDESCEAPEQTVAFLQVSRNTSKPSSTFVPLREAVESLCYDYLTQAQDGWENNDGAFGEFTFNLTFAVEGDFLQKRRESRL